MADAKYKIAKLQGAKNMEGWRQEMEAFSRLSNMCEPATRQSFSTSSLSKSTHTHSERKPEGLGESKYSEEADRSSNGPVSRESQDIPSLLHGR